MSERTGDVVAAVLLAAMVAIIVVTLVELVARGAPWSEHGYHATRNAHAAAARAPGQAVATPPALCLAVRVRGPGAASSCR